MYTYKYVAKSTQQIYQEQKREVDVEVGMPTLEFIVHVGKKCNIRCKQGFTLTLLSVFIQESSSLKRSLDLKYSPKT